MNIELKEYVFAQYLGQSVEQYDHQQNVLYVGIVRAFTTPGIPIETAILLLRPLSSITDNEAIEVVKLSGMDYNEHEDFYKQLINTNQFLTYFLDVSTLFYKEAVAIDMYLRQQGFALPIYHNGTLYPVSELVTLGIIKLKEG